jgi:predicted peptidase
MTLPTWSLMMWPLLAPIQPPPTAAQSAPAEERPASAMGESGPAGKEVRPAAAAFGFLLKSIEIDGQSVVYSVYVPPEYTHERPWPVILFLHGAGERGADGLLPTEVGIASAIRRHRDWFPAIVVIPQCAAEDVWWSEGMMSRALRCVEAVSREYHLDPQRLYLTGLSLGGAGTWHLGARAARHFAALVPICGFIDLGPSSGVEPRIARELRDTPVWVFHGGQDDRVPVIKSREMVAALRAAGGNVQYTEYPNGGHNVWDQAYADPTLWRWLFAQRKTPTSAPQP